VTRPILGRVSAAVSQARPRLGWWFAIVLVVVAGLLGAFAIYTWGWRTRDGVSSREQERARVFARELFCAGKRCGAYSDAKVERIAPGIWRVDFGRACLAVDVQRFAGVLTADRNPAGVGVVPCRRLR
jgi:hypothetical protein